LDPSPFSHIHAIATDGAFLPNGTFLCLPRINTDRLLAAWQTKVFKLLLAAEKIDRSAAGVRKSADDGPRASSLPT
jgi:hypothetical protein